jgi:hypothetical protein
MNEFYRPLHIHGIRTEIINRYAKVISDHSNGRAIAENGNIPGYGLSEMRTVCDSRMEDVREDSEGEGHRCVFRLSRPVGSLLTAAPDGAACCCSVIRSSSSIAS